jgi:hypothetical protein
MCAFSKWKVQKYTERIDKRPYKTVKMIFLFSVPLLVNLSKTNLLFH